MWLKVKMFRYKVLLKNKDFILMIKALVSWFLEGNFELKVNVNKLT